MEVPALTYLANETKKRNEMPEIIPEFRGRSRLPEEQKKKRVTFRLSPEAIARLESHVQLMSLGGNKMTKAQALENAINKLPVCES